MAAPYVDTLDSIMATAFPDLNINNQKLNWLCERTILALTIIFVVKFNEDLQRNLPGNLHIYKSIDIVADQEEAVNFPT